MAVAFLAMMGSMILLPLYLQNLRELSPLQTGLLVMPGGLAMGLDQDLEKPDKKGQRKLAARLYLVDTNGHLLAEAMNSSGLPAPFRASVVIAGRRFQAQPFVRGGKGEGPGQGEAGSTGYSRVFPGARTTAPQSFLPVLRGARFRKPEQLCDH